MTTTRRLSAALALGLTLSLSAACGGDNEPDPIPSPTESSNPGPEVSPAPDGPDLNAEQQAAFDTAVARFADYQEFGSRITANPTEPSLDEVTSELATFTVMPETKAWADSYDKLIDSGIRIEGARAVEWTVPVEVTEDKVVFDQCESPGTWTAIQGDEESNQTNNILTRVDVVFRDSTWLIQNQTYDREC